jgi:hypothetical protein
VEDAPENLNIVSKIEKVLYMVVIQCGKVCICTLLTQGEKVNPRVKIDEKRIDYVHSSYLTPFHPF